MAFEPSKETDRYSVDKKSKCVFVGMGGFDYNNLAESIIKILKTLDLYAIVAKSNNHLKQQSHVEMERINTINSSKRTQLVINHTKMQKLTIT